jgi:hypothetical protein
MDVVNVTKLAGSGGHCLGRRVVYVDKVTSAPLWEDLYDEELQPWRFVGFFPRTLDAPGIGPVDNSNSMVYGFWHVKYSHATIFAEAGEDEPFYVNQQAPNDFPRPREIYDSRGPQPDYALTRAEHIFSTTRHQRLREVSLILKTRKRSQLWQMLITTSG